MRGNPHKTTPNRRDKPIQTRVRWFCRIRTQICGSSFFWKTCMKFEICRGFQPYLKRLKNWSHISTWESTVVLFSTWTSAHSRSRNTSAKWKASGKIKKRRAPRLSRAHMLGADRWSNNTWTKALRRTCSSSLRKAPSLTPVSKWLKSLLSQRS